jgi:hypothetical protein
MMQSSDEDIELCSVDRFGAFYEKWSGADRRDKIKLVQLSSVRFEI